MPDVRICVSQAVVSGTAKFRGARGRGGGGGVGRTGQACPALGAWIRFGWHVPSESAFLDGRALLMVRPLQP